MDPQSINLNQVPKQFCEQLLVGSNDQTFILMPVVGTNATAYALSPEHAKSVAKALSEHITQFEKNVRPIRDVSAGVPSPIQTSELSGKDKGNEKK